MKRRGIIRFVGGLAFIGLVMALMATVGAFLSPYVTWWTYGPILGVMGVGAFFAGDKFSAWLWRVTEECRCPACEMNRKYRRRIRG